MHPGSPGPSALSHTARCGNLLGTNRLEKPWMHHRPLSIVWENINSKFSRCPHPATPQCCHPGHQPTRARLSPFLSWRLCSPVRWQRASAHTGPATESSSLISRTPRWERAVSRSSAGRARRTAGVHVHTRTRATPHPTPPGLTLPGRELTTPVTGCMPAESWLCSMYTADPRLCPPRGSHSSTSIVVYQPSK